MRFRVRRILLVSGLYDSFILAEDGQLNEAILRQYIDLNLSQNPDLIRVSRGAEALALARAEPFELILTSLEVGDMDAAALARQAAAAGIQAPVVLLAYNNRELTNLLARRDVSALDRVFLWQGDFRILIAMVKYVEDRVNAVPPRTTTPGRAACR
jgi:CheY-like chemotaxis protein